MDTVVVVINRTDSPFSTEGIVRSFPSLPLRVIKVADFTIEFNFDI